MYLKVKKSAKPYVVKANKIKDFPIESLWIPNSTRDGEYQRASRHYHVNRLVASWQDEVYTRPTVAVRPNGKNVVVNGAHTLHALVALGAVTAPCEYFISKDNDREASLYEAKLFGRKNTNLSMSACDSFKSEVVQKEPNALRVNRAITSCGLHVEGMKPKGIPITSIRACVNVYKRGGMGRPGEEHLKKVLSTLKKKWQGQEKCFHGGIVGGLSLFLNTYPQADPKILEKSMGTYPPARLYYNEDGSIGPAKREIVVAKNIRKFYNIACDKGHRLPIVSFSKKKKAAKKTKALKG